MKKQAVVIRLSIGLIVIFGCSNQTENNASQMDSSSAKKGILTDAFFTTSTIENALPEFKEKSDSCMTFHEDEWRQIEFISKDQKNSIDKEISKIKDIFENYSHKSGTYTLFKKVAVRDLITQPMAVDYSKFKSYLTDKAIKTEGLSLYDHTGQVKNGFFFALNGVNYYGIVDNNIVNTFCIYSMNSSVQLKSIADELAKFLEGEKLYLVDWRRMNVLDEMNIHTELVGDNN